MKLKKLRLKWKEFLMNWEIFLFHLKKSYEHPTSAIWSGTGHHDPQHTLVDEIDWKLKLHLHFKYQIEIGTHRVFSGISLYETGRFHNL